MNEDEFETALKTRAGNRPDSFYQKLLRKMKLAKKTDTSSGIAVIDITEDENEGEVTPSKRSYECEEIEDNDSTKSSPAVKRPCLHEEDGTAAGASIPLSHFQDGADATGSGANKLSHFNSTNGVDCQQPIVIDDESENEDDIEKETGQELSEELIDNEQEETIKEKEDEVEDEKNSIVSEENAINETENDLTKNEEEAGKEMETDSKDEEIINTKDSNVNKDGDTENTIDDDNQENGDKENEAAEESDDDDDDDEIEIISEDIGCAITFGN